MSSHIPTDLRYAETHEWARLQEDGIVTVGITDHAQHLLGDLVFVELPEVGRTARCLKVCGQRLVGRVRTAEPDQDQERPFLT